MEGPGGGSSTAALPLGGSGGGNGGNLHQQQQQQQQPWGATTQFYTDAGGMPPGSHQSQQNQQQQQQQQQQQNHLQLLHQQQLMQIAAAAVATGQAGPQGQQLVAAGQPMNSMIPASQAPTINMMIQGMANQGMGHHTLPSPSSSGAGVQPGFFTIIPTGHHQGGRDISPGSTPGLGHHPAPSATPPTLMEDRCVPFMNVNNTFNKLYSHYFHGNNYKKIEL